MFICRKGFERQDVKGERGRLSGHVIIGEVFARTMFSFDTYSARVII